jgi:hypothetical protein
MFRSFLSTIFRGPSAVLCAVTIPPADLRSLSLYCYAVCGRVCMSSVRVWCSCLLVICLWKFASRSPIDKNTKHAQVSPVLFRSNVSLFIFWILWTSRNYSKELFYYKWHTHAATYCVTIQTQRTQISGRNSKGTKHSGGPPEDGREKRPKHVGVLYLQTRF